MKKYIKHILIGLATGMANGLFGSGGGTIAVPAMERILEMDKRKAHATAISIMLPLTLMSSLFYIRNGFVDWDITLNIALGGIPGGFIGAKILNICPKRILKIIFGLFMIAAAYRMVVK